MSELNTHTFSATGPVEVSLDVVVGRVELVASDRKDVQVTISPRSESRSGDVEAAKASTVDFSGGRVSVQTPKGIPLIGTKSSVVVEIAVPTGSRIGGKVGYANLRARGRFGDVRLTLGYGEVDFDETDELHLKVSSGNITVGEIHGDAELVLSNGDIRVERVDGDVIAKSTNGDIRIEAAGGKVEATNANGSVLLGVVGVDTFAKTAYGRVRVGRVDEGSVRLESSYGELEVGVPEGTAAWLDISSQRGSVLNDLSADSAAPASGAKTVQIRARSTWGDVVIRRPKSVR